MTPGSVGFFEIHVDDFQRAQQFYHNVFGWKFSESGGVPYEFYMIDNSTKGSAGLQEGGMRKREKPLADSGVSGAVCYIIVESIDEALEKITDNGGKVLTQKVLIPAGYFAYALDTERNTFGIWELAR
jgi:predicted enzyme related to lactoylglutathione lyase